MTSLVGWCSIRTFTNPWIQYLPAPAPFPWPQLCEKKDSECYACRTIAKCHPRRCRKQWSCPKPPTLADQGPHQCSPWCSPQDPWTLVSYHPSSGSSSCQVCEVWVWHTSPPPLPRLCLSSTRPAARLQIFLMRLQKLWHTNPCSRARKSQWNTRWNAPISSGGNFTPSHPRLRTASWAHKSPRLAPHHHQVLKRLTSCCLPWWITQTSRFDAYPSHYQGFQLGH